MTAEDKKRDSYYRRKYFVTLDWYNRRFEEQNGCCGICRRPQNLFTKRFAVDHCHLWSVIKIETCKVNGEWYACTSNNAPAHYLAEGGGKTKSQAIRSVRHDLRRKSVRGLLCPFCNRGLRFYADDPTRLANAAEYLRRHQNAN